MKKRVCSYYVFLLVFTLVFSTFVTPVSFGAINESATEKASALSDSDKNKSESSASDQNIPFLPGLSAGQDFPLLKGIFRCVNSSGTGVSG